MSQMHLCITVRKPVENPEQGQNIYNLVKERLADREDLTISGHVTNHFDMEEPG